MISQLLSISPTILALLGSGVTILYFLLAPLLSPQRSIPGPFLARFTRLWYFIQIYKGDFERRNISLHEEFGPVVRVAPDEYSVNDVEAARTIYGLGKGFVKVCFIFHSIYSVGFTAGSKAAKNIERYSRLLTVDSLVVEGYALTNIRVGSLVLGLDATGSNKSFPILRSRPSSSLSPAQEILLSLLHVRAPRLRTIRQQLHHPPHATLLRTRPNTHHN